MDAGETINKIFKFMNYPLNCFKKTQKSTTVCPGSSDPSEKIFDIFASENEVYTIY